MGACGENHSAVSQSMQLKIKSRGLVAVEFGQSNAKLANRAPDLAENMYECAFQTSLYPHPIKGDQS